MKKHEASEILRAFAKRGCIRTSSHCRDMMQKRNATMQDILHIIVWGEVISVKEDREHGNWKCRIAGADLDDDKLTIIAGIDESDGAIIITVFG